MYWWTCRESNSRHIHAKNAVYHLPTGPSRANLQHSAYNIQLSKIEKGPHLAVGTRYISQTTFFDLSLSLTGRQVLVELPPRRAAPWPAPELRVLSAQVPTVRLLPQWPQPVGSRPTSCGP